MINKFCGDHTLLHSGLHELEALTGMDTKAAIPSRCTPAGVVAGQTVQKPVGNQRQMMTQYLITVSQIGPGSSTRVDGLQLFDAHTVFDSTYPVMISHDDGSYEAHRGEIRANNEQPWGGAGGSHDRYSLAHSVMVS